MDRCQSVCVSCAISASRHLTFGLPQGSVTDPNGFSFYSDPVSQITDQHSVSVHIYADNTQLYLPFAFNETDANRAVIQIEDCIDDTRKWIAHNKLKLNEEKTDILIYVPSHQTRKCSINSLTIGGYKVEASGSVRNLGVMFDSCMQMKAQVNSVVKSCHHQLRNISNIRKYLSIDAFISSRLDYANSLLTGLHDTEFYKLQKIQNNAAHILTRTNKYDHTTPVLKDLHWLTMRKQIEFKILILTYVSA